ncbi:cytochrome P460 [Ferrimonas sediminicola]|uniref:Cytochrome P460 n=2 Tax=Ferrimonas sediminicola TaxID=2569538 RepID=A0A4U1BCY0_9GAMM|nr:cytochrome P460 [Ferrimonas sediminicola]
MLPLLAVLASAEAATPPSSNGIDYPTGWQEWALIAVSHRTDNGTLRAILGNDTAVKAARAGQTNPWPDGTVLAKAVWKGAGLENWSSAVAPKAFVHAEFMIKDSVRFAETYGWGWARWLGETQAPFADGPQVCISCHTPVRGRDWVFTDPAPFPH